MDWIASPSSIRMLAVAALRGALERSRPAVVVDRNGYVGSFEQNLVPTVQREDFEADLMAGDGNELAGKFRAAHSSSALAVNCFGSFRRHPDDLELLGTCGFSAPCFERKCPTGLRGGRAPNLDVIVESPEAVIGIESKLTEFLGPHRADFSPAYAEQIRDDRRNEAWFREMLRLADAPDAYELLDAVQLIKHAFGLARTFPDRPVTLLYLFWEPQNAAEHPVFAAHRREVAEFADRLVGATPAFAVQSYPELWRSWDASAAADWLREHLAHVRGRYAVSI